MKEYIWQFILTGILSYFIGNINFAVIISKSVKHEDIRMHGSGNPGTTNMMRVFGLKYGALTLACDMVKGIIPVIASYFIFKCVTDNNAEIYRFAMYLAALCATVGHVFPVFMKFKGGKGFATSVGVLLAIQPVPTLIILAIGFIIILICDRMSVFALFYVSAELAFHILAYFGLFKEVLLVSHAVTLPMLIIVCLFWVLVVFAHRSNIIRLLRGKESPSGLRKSLLRLGKKHNKQQDDTTQSSQNSQDNDGSTQNIDDASKKLE